jgi:hypothetical protein
MSEPGTVTLIDWRRARRALVSLAANIRAPGIKTLLWFRRAISSTAHRSARQQDSQTGQLSRPYRRPARGNCRRHHSGKDVMCCPHSERPSECIGNYSRFARTAGE